MGKGLKSKAGRVLQMILLGANPNLFVPLGKRTICSNAEDYDYTESIEFDKLSRKGAKSLTANVPLEEMWQGKMTGPLHYNLIDDQILPFWIAKGTETPIVVGGVNCLDTEYVRPQLDRADRAHFAIEEGKPGTPIDMGCYGLFTSFKWSSKRGNKGTSRFEANFVTQAAVQRANLSGSVAQNAKFRLSGANVAGDVTLSVRKMGALSEQVIYSVGDSPAAFKTKLEALLSIDGVTVTGTIAIASGELHVLICNGATDNATIYGTVVVTPGMTILALQNAIRALGGDFANVTVTGGTSAPTNAALQQGATTTIPLPGNAVPVIATGANGPAPQDFAYEIRQGGAVIAYHNPGVGDSLVGWGVAHQSGESFSITVPAGMADGANYEVRVKSILSGSPVYYSANFSVQAGASIQAMASSGSYNLQFPNGVGNVTDITPAAGANWSTSVTQAGAAGGAVDFEIVTPSNVNFTISKVAGNAGYTISQLQEGSDGNILTAMLPEDPILPGHLFLYSSTTAAGLDEPTSMIGQIGEWELDDPKICMPVSHHIPIVDPQRPNLPATYNAHAEEDSQEDGPKLTVTMDADEEGVIEGMVGLLRASGSRTVSAPRYWRIAAIRPGSPRRVWVDFYGSIGGTAERKFGGAIEQRTLVFDLLENKEVGWNFKVKTRRPV